MKSFLILLTLGLMGAGLIGLIRPGPQWWRTTRRRAALILVLGIFTIPISTFMMGFVSGFLSQSDRIWEALDELDQEVGVDPINRTVNVEHQIPHDTLRKEFHRYVVHPCMTGLLEQNNLSDQVTLDEFIALSKKTGHYATVEQAEVDTIKAVADEPEDMRLLAYEIALDACLTGALAETAQGKL